MSEDKTNQPPRHESRPAFEKAGMQDADMQDVHEQLMREKDEPAEGFSPVPIFLIFIFAALCFWGGVYFIQYSGNFRWDVYDPEYDASVAAAPRPEISLFDRGAKVFRSQCAQCHQANGQGVPGAFPTLVASRWVTGSEERLARILVNGLNGPIVVAGSKYNGNMPAFGPNGLNLKPKDIAGVLTYIRQEWGNEAAEVSVEAMEAYTGTYGSRGTPWTAEELLADFPLEQ
ncbi:MAG: c-type cytochrome [Coraliomargarita sp.]